MSKLPPGVPCVGEPHARFDGRGRRKPFPTPIRRGRRRTLDKNVRGDAFGEIRIASFAVNFKIDVAMVVQVNFLLLDNRWSLCNQARSFGPMVVSDHG